jgi:hypothetical protein
MSSELAKLMFITVKGKKIAEDTISHVEIGSEFEAPDFAVVTVTDSEFKANEYHLGDRLEIRFQGKDFQNSHLFKGTVVGLEPKFESGGTKQVTIRGFSPKRAWQTPTVHGKEIPLEVPKSRVARLVIRRVPKGGWKVPTSLWDPKPLVREPQAIIRAKQHEANMSFLHMELVLASPLPQEIVAYTLDKHLQINFEEGAFKNPRGVVRRVKVSADREPNAVKLTLDLWGAADNF